jgi:hypothetical protein
MRRHSSYRRRQVSSRRLALLGAPVGPWVYTARVLKPRVRVLGLAGGTVHITTLGAAGGDDTLVIPADGTHDIFEASSSVSVEILSGAA